MDRESLKRCMWNYRRDGGQEDSKKNSTNIQKILKKVLALSEYL